MPEIQTSQAHEIVREHVCRLLSIDTEESGYTYSPEFLALALVDQGEIVGGLTGVTNWNWLYIETLAVAADYRGQGFARDLVNQAEQMAMERGCCGSWVDTFTFQVPEFYIRLGYEQFGELPDYPRGQSRVFLRKLLGDTK